MKNIEFITRPSNDNENVRDPHALAITFAPQILRAIASSFDLAPDELKLLSEDQAGIYISKDKPDTLCCLVLGTKNAHMYLVTGEVSKDGNSISDFKTAVIG